MDKREAERFLSKLYRPGQSFEVLYTQPEGGVRRVTRVAEPVAVEGSVGFVDYTAVLAEFERAEAAGYNVYVSAMPLDVQATGKFDRIWVDQDDPEAPYPFGADPNWDGPQWPEPTTLVKTSSEAGGFRWQAIWLFDGAIEAQAARTAMKQLAKKAGADEAVHDARRVLRVPGILNAKRGSAARLVSTSDKVFGLSAFNLPADTALSKLFNAEVNDTKAVLGEWLAGVTEGDRNRKAYVAARFLKGCGVSWADAAAILKLGAMRSNPPLDDDELEHTLNSAYHRST
jgi:hypothetical protein